MRFIYCLLCVYGLTILVVHGSIFDGLKKWLQELAIKNDILAWFRGKGLEAASCVMCSSFWIGGIVNMYFGVLPWWNFIMAGGMMSGGVWILNSIVVNLGQGSDPGKVINLIISEPIKITKVEEEKI